MKLSEAEKRALKRSEMKIPDGMISLGSEAADALGFTAEKFDGYLWRKGEILYISLIISKQQGQGHLSDLFETIWRLGYEIRVPTPSARMESILRKKGFVHSLEDTGEGDCFDCWTKKRVPLGALP